MSTTDADPKPTRRRRLEPDARRAQILECAATLFSERPYTSVSTTHIAQAAGVARGLLNHYFGTKRALYLQVVQRVVDTQQLGIEFIAAGSLDDRVNAGVDWYLQRVDANRIAYIVVIGAAGLGNDPEIESILDQADNDRARDALTSLGIAVADQTDAQRAVMRTYTSLVTATVRAWIKDNAITRAQARLLIGTTLYAIGREVLPALADAR